jgi:peroxiredoxin
MKLSRLLPVLFIASLCLSFTGDKAKKINLRDLQNKQVELKTLLQKGPVLIDFWATWCKPCIKAFPELEAIYTKYKDKGLTVVGINTDGPRSQAKVKPFVNGLKITFPVLIDRNGKVMRQYRVQVLPTSFLIAQDGTIVATNVGYLPQKMKELEKLIAELVAKNDDESK